MNDGLSEDQEATWSAYRRRMHIELMTGLDRQLAREVSQTGRRTAHRFRRGEVVRLL